MNPFFVMIVGVACSMLAIPLAARLAPALGMVDLPDSRKVHTQPIPRVGGWGIVLGALIPIAIAVRLDPLMQSFIIGGLILFLYGLWDDAKQISHWVKFSGQIFAVALVIWYGDLWIERLPFMGVETIAPAIGKPFTLFAIVGMINAVNHSDGLDGLASGETLLTLIAIAFLAYIVSDADYGGVVVTISFAVIGGILGFLRFNTHPARVFMGDSGSQFLGFTSGFLAVYLTQVVHPALSPALPLLFLGLPIVDILAVLAQRIAQGVNWFRATRNHVHHRLLDIGFDHYETVVIIYSIQALLVVSSALMRYQNDWRVAGLYAAVCTAVFSFLLWAERSGWRAHGRHGRSALTRLLEYLQTASGVRRWVMATVYMLVTVFIVATPIWAGEVPRDFGVIGGVVAVVLLLELLFGRNGNSVIIRGCSYVAATFVVYLSLSFPPIAAIPMDVLSFAYFITLAALMALMLKLAKEIPFNTTPTDYLIVFGILVIALFANEFIRARETCIAIVEAVILLYGCELIIARTKRRWNSFNAAALISLATIGLRGLLHG
jgi:UDP-GlcNAc:undecaprenyl-phosphate GlcNAc-1-phosphate transferase